MQKKNPKTKQNLSFHNEAISFVRAIDVINSSFDNFENTLYMKSVYISDDN